MSEPAAAETRVGARKDTDLVGALDRVDDIEREALHHVLVGEDRNFQHGRLPSGFDAASLTFWSIPAECPRPGPGEG